MAHYATDSFLMIILDPNKLHPFTKKVLEEVCVLLNKLTLCVLYQRRKGDSINLRLPFPIEG